MLLALPTATELLTRQALFALFGFADHGVRQVLAVERVAEEVVLIGIFLRAFDLNGILEQGATFAPLGLAKLWTVLVAVFLVSERLLLFFHLDDTFKL